MTITPLVASQPTPLTPPPARDHLRDRGPTGLTASGATIRKFAPHRYLITARATGDQCIVHPTNPDALGSSGQGYQATDGWGRAIGSYATLAEAFSAL